ncbi:MAG: hypothetical protein R3B46_06680 [Phycisphaerales bacterium]
MSVPVLAIRAAGRVRLFVMLHVVLVIGPMARLQLTLRLRCSTIAGTWV